VSLKGINSNHGNQPTPNRPPGSLPSTRPENPLVAVIILNWNGCQDTLDCIRSLQRSSYPHYRILVVDNGSSDDSVSTLRQSFAEIEILETGTNLGFAGGVNAGMRHVLQYQAVEYIWLLNNDTLVQADSLDLLRQFAHRHPRVGVLGCTLVDAHRPDVVQSLGGEYFCLWSGIPRPTTPHRPPNYICGASMFVRRSCIEQCGFLDADYFFYFEDMEFCFRIRQRNWEVATVDQVVIRHKGSASIGAKGYMQAYWYRRGLIRFMRGHAPLPGLPILATTAARILLASAARNWPVVRGTWRGFRDGLAG
jgi:GT2 family glycosyltransferase